MRGVDFGPKDEPVGNSVHFDLINNAFLQFQSSSRFSVLEEHGYISDGVTFSMHGNAASASTEYWFNAESGEPNDPHEAEAAPLNGCPRANGDPCLSASDNFTTSAPASADTSVSAGSDLTEAGVDPSMHVEIDLAMTSVAGDFYGACRNQSAPTVGAMEP